MWPCESTLALMRLYLGSIGSQAQRQITRSNHGCNNRSDYYIRLDRPCTSEFYFLDLLNLRRIIWGPFPSRISVPLNCVVIRLTLQKQGYHLIFR
ncbi:hypothetical protein BKA60DRAFT_578033 [Fusarium oxysporum]|nr:hypothetical protein BKA60DRAFT_578033 [Fusarium oxysporum]